jgi:hypothetical protein
MFRRTVLVAEPLAVMAVGSLNLVGLTLVGQDLGQKAQLKHFSDDPLGGRRDDRFLACRRPIPGVSPHKPSRPSRGHFAGKIGSWLPAR